MRNHLIIGDFVKYTLINFLFGELNFLNLEHINYARKHSISCDCVYGIRCSTSSLSDSFLIVFSFWKGKGLGVRLNW